MSAADVTAPGPLAVHRDPPFEATHDARPEFSPAPVMKAGRLVSLDVFRGLTIAMMVLVNNNGNDHQYRPLEHAAWHGWTPTDLVFPFFLFIVGVAIPFSLGGRRERATRGQLLGRIWLRALSLIMLGMTLRAIAVPLPWLPAPDGFYFTKAMRWSCYLFGWIGTFALLVPWKSRRLSTWLPIVIAVLFVGLALAMHFVRIHAIASGWPEKSFGGSLYSPDMMRIPGVLQRIGICYGIAATIALFAGWRTVLLSALALCTLYIVLMFNVKVEGHTLGSLTMEDNFARTVDVAVFERSHLNELGKRVWTQKHTYSDYPDNEGLVSTLPAIATSLIGILVGFWLRTPHLPSERCAGLLAFAGPVIFVGVVLDHALMPINKNLWTPSFTVFTAGMAMLVLGTIFWLCDVLGRRRIVWPFTVMGMNAIAAFVASNLVLYIARIFPYFTLNDGNKGTITTFTNQRLVAGLHHTSDWLHTHAPRLPEIATPQNESLIYALAFVLVIWLLMLVLYLCRVFIKI